MDAKVAAALCPGGPVVYKLKEGSGVANQFLHEHMVPDFAGVFGKHSSAPLVLGRALLWGIMDGSIDNRFLEVILQQV